jgi:hypothetical protein
VSVQYEARWYENRSDDNWDQNVTAILKANHKFSPRYNLDFDNVFTYANEPTILEPGSVITAPAQLRSETTGVRNRPALNFTAALTERIGVAVGFVNLWYDYFQDQQDATTPANPLGLGSQAAVLNRLEYYPSIDLRYQVQQNLVGLIGYQLGITDYTSDDPIAVDVGDPLNPQFIPGSIRSMMSHYLYIGAEYSLTTDLTAAGKVGATYVSYDDLDGNDGWSPYLDGSLTYQYLPGDQITAGVRYQPSATDVAAPAFSVTSLDQITASSDTFVFYTQVAHRITPKLTAILTGTVQHSLFQGGFYNDDVDWYFVAGLGLNYRFNQWWSAEIGYNYDRLDSDIDFRGFTRNRGYLGVRATY